MAANPVELQAGRRPTPAQRPLLASHRRFPDEPVQNMALVAHIDAPVDAERLDAAFCSVVADNRVLRSRWPVESGGRAVFAPEPVGSTSTIIKLDRAEAARLFDQRVRLPLDIEQCCYDSCIAVHDDGTVSWYLNLHHAITDAASSVQVWRATVDAYHRSDPTIASDVGAGDGGESDYFATVARLTSNPTAEAARAYWEDQPPAPRLGRLYRAVDPTDCEATRTHPTNARPELGAISAQSFDRYRLLSDDLTVTAALATVTAAYLHRIAGGTHFALGIPVHNRRGPQAARVIGPLMEVFPLTVHIEPDDTFESLHRRLSRDLMDLMRHAAPGASGTGRYEAVVNVIPQSGYGSFGSVPVTTEWLSSGTIDPAQLIRVQYTGYGHDEDGLVLDIGHSGTYDDHRRVAPEHFARLLAAMVADPETGIGSVDLVTDEEHAAISAWEHGPPTPEQFSAVNRMVDNLNRDRVRIDTGDGVLTGPDLRSRIRAVTARLDKEGVGPDSRVAIELSRSTNAVVAIMGTLLAGASYVPIDPALPTARRESAYRRSNCRLSIDSAFMAELDAGATSEPLGDEQLPVPVIDADDEAYLLFTSGSTGEPKGVPITHHGLNRYLAFALDSYSESGSGSGSGSDTDDADELVVGFYGALSFDLTVTSLFLPFLAGGTMVMITEDGPAAVAAVAADRRINWLKATPSHLDLLVRSLPADHALATLVIGGEALTSGTVKRIRAIRPEVRVFNEYGPTEAVVGCMIHESPFPEPPGDVPIGVPAPGVELRVVDGRLRRVPIGVVGELLIRAEGQTAGYLDRPEADAAFVTVDGHRFYATGDLVRLHPGGPAPDYSRRTSEGLTATYMGRADEQMKVGGIRLDPTEVENALTEHPWIDQAAVRLWSPSTAPPERRCDRCGIADNVPDITIDRDGICSTCRAFDRVREVTAGWFGTPDDLIAIRDSYRARRTGRYDCLHLLSGGKDSTYALYQLVEHGFEPYVLTLDNGYISSQAKDNIARTVADLGLDHEFATTEHMKEIFRDSLERYSNVCQGCYKTIYTLATSRAVELGIPAIVTGLSRGQLFETRLIPQQFTLDRFDPDAIDAAVVDARRIYHHVDDGPNRLLDTTVFDDPNLFERIAYLDLYRYLDVPLEEMLSFLDRRAPWVRPTDTGRSTNCLINDAGIHTHLTEQGYHNYAVPYAWDVRLGHKTRAEAIEELTDHLESDSISSMLNEVGYQPTPRRVLTAWYRPTADAERHPEPGELRAFLGQRVPSHAIPSAFVAVDQLPLGQSGKLAMDRLPAPTLTHRRAPGLYVAPTTPLERAIIDRWQKILQVEPVGRDDHFFDLGGDSLAALEAIVELSSDLGVELSERLLFLHPTARLLAQAIEAEGILSEPRPNGYPAADQTVADHTATDHTATDHTATGGVPLYGPEELAARPTMLDQVLLTERERLGVDTAAYNVGHLFRLEPEPDGQPIDPDRIVEAAWRVAAAHDTLCLARDGSQRPFDRDRLVDAEVGSVRDEENLRRRADELNRRPFDLSRGPLLRVGVWSLPDGSTAVLLGLHHVSADADGVGIVWRNLMNEFVSIERDDGREAVNDDGEGGDDDGAAQALARVLAPTTTEDLEYWVNRLEGRNSAWNRRVPAGPEPDGFVSKVASLPRQALHSLPGVSPRAVMLAALDRALAAATGGPATVGLVSSLRTGDRSDQPVGYFLNTLPFQLDRIHDQAAAGAGIDRYRLLRGVQSELVSGLAHRTVLHSRIAVETGAAVDGLLSYQDDPEGQALFNGVAVGPFTLFADGDGDTVHLSAEYRGMVLTGDQARELVAQVAAIASDLVTNPDRPIDRFEPVRSGLSGPPLTRAWSLGRLDRWLHDSAGPDDVAVTVDDRSHHRRDVALRTRALARALVASGVEPGDRVALRLDRSADLVAAVVATLAVGASYVAVDPTYPPGRIRQVLAVSEPKFTVDDVDHLLATAPTVDDEQFDRRWLADYGGDTEAYLILTSGSTGEPKAVAISRERLERTTAARLQHYGDDRADYLVVSSFGFDSSVAGLFHALATGGTVVLPSSGRATDPGHLAGLASSGRVTNTLMVPTLYRAVLAAGADRNQWPGTVVVAGETCPPDLVDEHHRRHPDSELHNEYGPTEATVWATVHRCQPGERPVPIGRPIPGTSVAVVARSPIGTDRPEADRTVADGVVGEIRIGGFGVHDGTGRYRTGDLGYVSDGVLHFLGRVDDQLNRGGVRLEAATIIGVVTALDGVEDCVVRMVDGRSLEETLVDLDPDELRAVLGRSATAEEPARHLIESIRATATTDRLVVFASAAGGGDRSGTEGRIWDTLVDNLAPAALPDAVVVLDGFPTTANGKVDTAALDRMHRDRTSPRGDGGRPLADPELANRIASVFSAVTGHRSVGLNESFFDIGGHSLMLVELSRELAEEAGVEATAAEVFRLRTPAGLSTLGSRTSGSSSDRGSGKGSDPGLNQYLMTIQDGRHGLVPLFGIHVLGVNGAFYRPLAAALGPDRPVHGLGMAGAVPTEAATASTDVVAVARSYATIISEMATERRVALAAVSVGAVMAMEVANQLDQMGVEVIHISLFDAAGPHAHRFGQPRSHRLAAHLDDLRSRPADYVRAQADKRLQVGRRELERLELKVRKRMAAELPHRLQHREFVEQNVANAVAHTPPHFDGDVTVFKAADDPYLRYLVDHGMGWAEFVGGSLDVPVVPGTHLGILEPVNVGAIADHLRPVLEQADPTTAAEG